MSSSPWTADLFSPRHITWNVALRETYNATLGRQPIGDKFGLVSNKTSTAVHNTLLLVDLALADCVREGVSCLLKEYRDG